MTIREVAAKVGVSAMTVSRAINNVGTVNPETRERIAAVIKELKFSPNASARRLAAVRGTTIALVYDNPSSGFMGEFLLGALDGSNQASATLVVRKHDDAQAMHEVLDGLALAGVEGILLVPPLCDSATAVEMIEAAGLPVVSVASGRGAVETNTVGIDNARASAEVADHLLALGHRRFGFIGGGHAGQAGSTVRQLGFTGRLMEAGIPEDSIAVEFGAFTTESGRSAAERILDRSDRPIAIFAANDEMAAGAVAAALGRAIAVPDALSIVGFDDTPIARAITPALTTVHQPVTEMAAAAVELLVESIRQSRAGARSSVQLIQQHRLVIRQSSARPVSPQGSVAR